MTPLAEALAVPVAAKSGRNLETSRRAGEVVQFVRDIRAATPVQLVEFERSGVPGRLVKALATSLNVPTRRFYAMLGVPKATAEKRAADGQHIDGAAGQAALGVVKLLGMVQSIVAESLAPEAEGFDAGQWLGQWIERPQPALGGRKPAELLDTPTGLEVVSRLLGSVASGAYQ